MIIIFLNAERFLTDAIQTVLDQTCDAWELLLVDDGSTDASSRMAQEWVARHPERIHYLTHPGRRNHGAAASRNLGLRHSGGRYVAFLDADDLWLPEKLARQVQLLEAHPEAGMVYGRARYWDESASTAEDARAEWTPPHGIVADRLYDPPHLLTLLYPLGEATPPCPSDVLVRREVLQELGGFEESFVGFYQLYEDHAFYAKLYLHAPVWVSSESFIRYRIHADSCDASVMRAGRYHPVRRFFLEWLESYLANRGPCDPAVLDALGRALLPYRRPLAWRLAAQIAPRIGLHPARLLSPKLRRSIRVGCVRKDVRSPVGAAAP